LSKTSLTEAGQPKPSARSNSREDLVQTINQVFTLFRINFHNQFYKAYSDDRELLNQAKKLWYESLKNYSASTVLEATKRIIEEQEYLPTLHQMLSRCAEHDCRAPDVHQAYVEACNAPSPKAKHDWSHPAVYEAGRRSDWYFLSTTPQQYALSVFRNNYQTVLGEISRGQQIDLPQIEDQGQSAQEDGLTKKEGLSKVAALRKKLNL
jgi:hypothetical protein